MRHAEAVPNPQLQQVEKNVAIHRDTSRDWGEFDTPALEYRREIKDNS